MNIIQTRTWIHLLQIGIVVSLITPPVSAEQASVRVNVNGLRSQKGQVVVCFWREQDKSFPICSNTDSFQHTAVKATTSTIDVRFQNVPSGDYAISAFHDENQNGILDRGFMGRPNEGIGFSNMTKERERPSFNKAKFKLNGEQTISFSLKYF